MNQMELTILDFIQEHMRNAFLDVGMPFVSTLGNAGSHLDRTYGHAVDQ